MFESLTEKLNVTFKQISNRGRLNEKDVEGTLKSIRIALLEADVNFKVALDFVLRLKDQLTDDLLAQGLNPSQHVIKAVDNELRAILGTYTSQLIKGPTIPNVILLVGLQGSGKTSTAAKLALYLKNQYNTLPLLVPADTKRAAATEQLMTLAKTINMPFYNSIELNATPLKISTNSLNYAKNNGTEWVIIDTGGRTTVDTDLMNELSSIKSAVNPCETLLVLDAMTGQDAVRTASEFQKVTDLTGLILSKLDGDARGGAALSVTAVSGIPIKFIGTGEKPDSLETFHPDRMASRILGMGDMLSLIEKAEVAVDKEKQKAIEKKFAQANFDLQDLLDQIRVLHQMGPLEQIMGMVPGMSQMKNQLGNAETNQKRLSKFEAIVLSMTSRERTQPVILNGSRKRRIAIGSGTTVQDINQLLKQFKDMQKLMRQFSPLRKNKQRMQKLFLRQ
jgi:signal recognition particle subunit SRP54